MKVARIGVGGSVKFLDKFLFKLKGIEVVSCFDTNKKRMQDYAKRFKVNATKTFGDAINDADAVIITTPNKFHKKQVIDAAKAGKHIFVEKPIANNVKDAKEMVSVCKKNKVILAVGHDYRKLDAIRKIKSLIRKNLLGKILFCEGWISSKAGYGIKKRDWRYSKRNLKAGCLMQLGIHLIDSFNYLLGKPEKVIDASFSNVSKSEIYDFSDILVEYNKGVKVNVGCSYVSDVDFYVCVYGKKGKLQYDWKRGLAVINVNGRSRKIKLKRGNSKYEDLKDFVESVNKKKKPEVGGEEAIDALMIVEKALKFVK